MLIKENKKIKAITPNRNKLMSIQYEKDGKNLLVVRPTIESYTKDKLQELLAQVQNNLYICEQQKLNFEAEIIRLQNLIDKAIELNVEEEIIE